MTATVLSSKPISIKLQSWIACRFTSTGHIEFEVADFRYIQEGQSKGEVDLSQLGFFINPIELEGKLELDLAQVPCFIDGHSRITAQHGNEAAEVLLTMSTESAKKTFSD